MARNISVQDAQRIVQRLTERYGYLDEDMMKDIGQWKPEYRRRIDRNWLAMENTASHSIKTLAKEIYGSGARFVFELLQNADDNSFSEAAKNNEEPFILFKVFDSKIIVECNEDGFTESDLNAICAVGQSTKSAKFGYIGAKGIGFKSVFIAAWNVYIQSGNFSFEFNHERDDPGLGMVRPHWVPPKETIQRSLTRMTLKLHRDELGAGSIKEVILEQLGKLQQTCLLFLANLQRIMIEYYDVNERLTKSTEFRKEDVDEFRVRLKRTSVMDGKPVDKSRIYHITKQKASDLSLSAGRAPPTTAEGKQAASTAEVILGFPLEDNYSPLCTSPQELFAFLPLRGHDYKFIIHSDFDTNASREAIVTTSSRNISLRKWIASAFVTAVLEFCSHPTLCYEWPMFLPTRNENRDTASNDFWAGLNNEIQKQLTSTPVLRSRISDHLRCIREIRILSSDFQLDGEPLLNDEEKDLFISPNYSSAAEEALKPYGLRLLTTGDVLDLLKTDIDSPHSRMYHNTNEDWHIAVAKLFCSWFVQELPVAQRLKGIPLLPVRGGDWCSVKDSRIYFPTTDGFTIPKGVRLRTLDPAATAIADRRTLFGHLGVETASIRLVRLLIFADFDGARGIITLRDAEAYLHYLYFTHKSLPVDNDPGLSLVWVATTGDTRTGKPSQKDIYLSETSHPFDAEKLLSRTDSAPGLSVTFADKTYTRNSPSQPSPDFITWERWLYDCMGIREHLRLESRGGGAPSDVFVYVCKHRPHEFLGLFRHLWKYEKSRVISKKELRRQISILPAKEICNVDYELKLKDTWLPIPRLKDKVARYMGDSKFFPFLELDKSKPDDDLLRDWQFLGTYFAVGYEENLDFLLDILRHIEKAATHPSSIGLTDRVYSLYVAIASKFVEESSDSARNKLRDFFSRGGIVVPHENQPVWATLSECLWHAPANLVSKYSLRYLYSRTIDKQSMTFVEQLFQDTIEMPSASADDIAFELETLSSTNLCELSHVTTLYEYLNSAAIPKKTLSLLFNQKQLIMVHHHGQRSWYKTSETLWSSAAAIRGKVTLDTHYEELRTFFVSKLGVKSLTLKMVYDELLQEQSSAQDDIRVAMLALSNFLRTERTLLDPDPLRSAKIFPVKHGEHEVVLHSVNTQFAIADRLHLEEQFRGRIALLDFDLEDVRRLGPFFFWLSLEDRYLSNSVREITSVDPDSGRSIRNLNRDLCRKAYFLLRVAATFSSPRYHSSPSDLYDVLRNLKTIETDEIHVTLQLSQNGKTIPIEDTSPNMHIDDSHPNVVIYVPRKRKAQDICFSSILPRQFLRWLMDYPDGRIQDHSDADATNALTSIFSCHRHALDEILNRLGIIQVDIENEDASDSENGEDSEDGSEQGGPASEGGAAEDELDSLRRELMEETVFGTIFEAFQRSQMAHERQPTSSAPFLSQVPSPTPPVQINGASLDQTTNGVRDRGRYRILLERVIVAAQEASFPSIGAFNLDSLRSALFNDPGDDAPYSYDGTEMLAHFRSTDQLERDIKVGAAGELYVFELLSTLGLPGWSRWNWQSTIRKYVREHPRYADMEPWNHRETADIIYNDGQGHLTKILIGCGYLTRDEWQDARPRYFLEVKTTTDAMETPFYMSANQYKLMQSKHRSRDRSEVYMILRVFGLNSRRMGMCAYLDPEALRRSGQLCFTGKTWSVVPGDGRPVVSV